LQGVAGGSGTFGRECLADSEAQSVLSGRLWVVIKSEIGGPQIGGVPQNRWAELTVECRKSVGRVMRWRRIV